MKKILAVLTALILLVAAAEALAEENGFMTMRVDHCNEWVSLRKTPSEKAKRLEKVKKGELVTECVDAENGFVSCRHDGKTGYILEKYLEQVTDLTSIPAKPDRALFMGAGRAELNLPAGPGNGGGVVVRTGAGDDTDQMMAVLYGPDGAVQDTIFSTHAGIGQVSSLSAFAGGTEEEPLLIWKENTVISAYRLRAPFADNRLWSVILDGEAAVGGGTSCTADRDGTLYMIGYFTDRLTRISPEGQPVWQVSETLPDYYWPYEIEVLEDRINVLYEGVPENESSPAVVSYSKEDGSLIGRGENGGNPEGQGNAQAGSAPAVTAAEAGDELPLHCAVVTLSEEEPVMRIVFTAKEKGVTGFQVLDLSLDTFDSSGNPVFSTKPVYTLGALLPEAPVAVDLTFWGDIPNNGISYTDGSGNTHRYAVEISGEDGSILLTEF